MKLLIVNNPISGGREKEELLKQARKICWKYGYQVAMYQTDGKDDASKLRAKIEKEAPEKVAVYGGDGTFAMVAEAAMHTEIPIGIVPCGSANGMAQELGVPKDCNRALEDILQSRYYADLDLIRINDERYCLHIADVGINADIVQAFEQDEARGLAVYGKYLLSALSNLQPFKVHVETPEETVDVEAVMIAFANGRKFGTGVPINTVGNPFDGKFEIDLVLEMTAGQAIKTGLSALTTLFANGDHKRTLSVTEAHVRFDRPRLLQVDGEVVGKRQALDVEIIEGAVKYVTTAANPYLLPEN